MRTLDQSRVAEIRALREQVSTLREALDVADEALMFVEDWAKGSAGENVTSTRSAIARAIKRSDRVKVLDRSLSEDQVGILCRDWAEDLIHLKTVCLAAGCTELEVEGDSYGVPGISQLADSLLAKLDEERSNHGSPTDAADPNGSTFARLKWWKDRCDELEDESARLRAIFDNIDEIMRAITPHWASTPTMDGTFPAWIVWLPNEGRTLRKSLKDALTDYVAADGCSSFCHPDEPCSITEDGKCPKHPRK